MPRPRPEGSVAALVSVWLDAAQDRGPVEAILGRAGTKLAGYLVTESIPGTSTTGRGPTASGRRASSR